MSPRSGPRALKRIAYQPGTSFLHRLHPLVKLGWLLAGTVFVFVVPSPWAAAGLVALLLLCFPLCGLRLGRLRGARLFFSTALLLGLLQVIFVRTGEPLWQLGRLTVTDGGLLGGVYVASRFLGVVLLSYMFVLTTEPNDLGYGLMQAGLPYRWGFALITALRLVPTFEQEGHIVYQAQLARGVRYDVRSPRRFLTLARQFFLPLLVSALGKVDSLAVSMEGRCFGRTPQRTWLREVRTSWRDGLSIALLIVGLAAVIFWRLTT